MRNFVCSVLLFSAVTASIATSGGGGNSTSDTLDTETLLDRGRTVCQTYGVGVAEVDMGHLQSERFIVEVMTDAEPSDSVRVHASNGYEESLEVVYGAGNRTLIVDNALGNCSPWGGFCMADVVVCVESHQANTHTAVVNTFSTFEATGSEGAPSVVLRFEP